MYRDKVAHSIREAGLDIDDYPLYERRRIRRLFLEKWNGNEDAETDAGPVPRLFRSQAYVGHLVAAGVSGPAVGMHAMPQQRRMIRA